MKEMKVQETPALDKKNGEQGVRTTIYNKVYPLYINIIRCKYIWKTSN